MCGVYVCVWVCVCGVYVCVFVVCMFCMCAMYVCGVYCACVCDVYLCVYDVCHKCSLVDFGFTDVISLVFFSLAVLKLDISRTPSVSEVTHSQQVLVKEILKTNET